VTYPAWDSHISRKIQKESHEVVFVKREDGRRELGGLAFRSMVLALLFLCIIVLVLGSGCSSPPPADGDNPPAPDILVEYQRTGGIAGFDDHLVVFENGQAIYTRRETPGSTPAGIFYLSDKELAELQRLLEEADFPGLAPHYPAPVPGADYFTYSITYKGKTVTTETTGVPPALAPVIGQLDYLLAEGS
jgi:hypothetical protein